MPDSKLLLRILSLEQLDLLEWFLKRPISLLLLRWEIWIWGDVFNAQTTVSVLQ